MGELIPVQPDRWKQLKSLCLAAVRSPNSRRMYNGALDDWLSWYQMMPEPRPPFFSKACVNEYRRSLDGKKLSASTINVRLSAIRKLAAEAVDNGLVDPELAAGIARVKGAPRLGVRTGNWLNRQQAERILDAPNPLSLTGKRDRAILGLLIGCGLRRAELATLTVGHVQQREGRWVLVDIIGKGGRIRSVPMPPWSKALIDDWLQAAGVKEGAIFRPLNRGGRLCGDSMDSNAIWTCVQKYARYVQVLNLAPHDLRRTYAKLAHHGKSPLEQIQLSLGHSSITTTEKYLGVRQDLSDAPCDHLGLRVTLPEKIG